jgi:hypothetical protein
MWNYIHTGIIYQNQRHAEIQEGKGGGAIPPTLTHPFEVLNTTHHTSHFLSILTTSGNDSAFPPPTFEVLSLPLRIVWVTSLQMCIYSNINKVGVTGIGCLQEGIMSSIPLEDHEP